MTEKRLNNCLVLHVHKCITNKHDLVEIAKEFVMVNDESRKYFGTFKINVGNTDCDYIKHKFLHYGYIGVCIFIV